MKTLLELAQELEDGAQYDNSSSGLRDTMGEVAAQLREHSAAQVNR